MDGVCLFYALTVQFGQNSDLSLYITNVRKLGEAGKMVMSSRKRLFRLVAQFRGLMGEIVETVKAIPESKLYDVTAVLLSGGSSKRFGPDNKLLAIRDGKPLIHHALDTIVRSQIKHLIVVLGHDASTIKKKCSDFLDNTEDPRSIDIEFTMNSDFESGMASSLRAGVSCLLNRNIKQADKSPHAALICLADMPLIKPQTINTLISAMDESLLSNPRDINRESCSAFVPSYENARGNPVLLMPDLFDLLLDIAGDVGARHLLQNNPDAVREVPVNDAGIFFDCDTPEQFER